MKKLLLTALTVFAFSAQANYYLNNHHNWNKGSLDAVEVAISAVEADYAKALEYSMAWRDTGKLIEEAKKLRKLKHTDEVLALLKVAQNQATRALEQAKASYSAGPRF